MDLTLAQVTALRKELWDLLQQLRSSPRDTAAIRTFLQVHAADLKITVGDGSAWLLLTALASHPDITLIFLEAGVQHHSDEHVYPYLLERGHIYNLNGEELEDAGIAARLQVMHGTHGLRGLRWEGDREDESLSSTTAGCVGSDRLECLRVMVQIDPHARGYTSYGHDSLLHIAVTHCNVRVVRFLLENGWTLSGHNLNLKGLSPLGACLMGDVDSLPPLEVEVLAVLEALLQGVDDASAVVHGSGLCDDKHHDDASSHEQHDKDVMLPWCRVHMLVYMCAAVRGHISLPRRVLAREEFSWDVVKHSPLVLRTLPLDEHVHTGIGDPIYLHDSLRVASSFDGAARHAAAVDALRSIEARLMESGCVTSRRRIMRESGATAVTGYSRTLRCWAWMRRLHAVTARQRILAQEAVRRCRQQPM